MTDRLKKNIIELTRMDASERRAGHTLPLRIMLDSVRSLNNVGSVLRTSDAFMVEEVMLGGITGTPPNVEIHKTALGAEDSVAWAHYEDALAALRALQQQGWRVCVLEQTHGSVELDSFEPRRDEKYVIVAGNEVHGVDQRIVDAADVVLEIPQCGAKHSLNVAVSSGIALWHFFAALR